MDSNQKFFARVGVFILSLVLAGVFTWLVPVALLVGLLAVVNFFTASTMPTIVERYQGGMRNGLVVIAFIMAALFGFVFLGWKVAIFYLLGVLATSVIIANVKR